jgi:hypothetical protein
MELNEAIFETLYHAALEASAELAERMHTRLFLEVLLVKESCSLISGESVRMRHLVIATQERRPGHCPPSMLIRTSRYNWKSSDKRL